MSGRSLLLLSVGSAAPGSEPPRLHPNRLPPIKGLFPAVSVSPQHTARRRERGAPRAPPPPEEEHAVPPMEKVALQSWVAGAEPELPVRSPRPENAVFHL